MPLVIVLFLFKNIHAQNLVSNSSFESSINNDCYGSFDHHIFPNPHILNNWYNFNSPDYFSTSCSGWYNIPNSYFGDNFTKQGDSYIGIEVFYQVGENKEYIYQQLSSPLQSGKIYCLSFYVSRADRMPFAIKQIGAYFSNTLPTMVSFSYINATPQIENQNGFISDTVQWTQIQGCFTANGGEQFITIGNFHDNASTDTLRIQSTNPLTGTGTDIAYYYIDDITLIDQTTVGINELENENEFSLYPNPNNGIFTINSKEVLHKIEVTDIAGQTLFSESTSEKTHQLQLQNFSQGIYFIKVHYPNGLSVTRKVIINR